MTATDWPAVAIAAVEALLGPPSSKTAKEWRWGRKGSFTLYLETGRWHDFEAGRGGGVLDLVERECKTDRDGALAWLEGQGLLTGTGRLGSAPMPSPKPKPKPTQPTAAEQADKVAQARRNWELARPIPTDPKHPARRWLTRRNLWRPEVEAPAMMRWLPPWGRHSGVGTIVLPLATPSAWGVEWPALPTPDAILREAVDVDGGPALLDRDDTSSRRRAWPSPVAGRIIIIGNPRLPELVSGAVYVCEGLADALAVASRAEGTAIATLGTSGMVNDWLATALERSARPVVILADDDKGGRDAASQLRRRLTLKGVDVRASLPNLPQGGKDAADGARASPFAPIEDAEGWRQLADTYHELDGWPMWDCERLAAITLQE